jgi:hypothetical protein
VRLCGANLASFEYESAARRLTASEILAWLQVAGFRNLGTLKQHPTIVPQLLGGQSMFWLRRWPTS